MNAEELNLPPNSQDMFNLLSDLKEKQELVLTSSKIESAISELFYDKDDEESDEFVDVDVFANPKSPEEIEKLIANPDSPFHKIISGYVYHAGLNVWLTTGCGGAQFLYKMLLKQGMSEEMIETIIYVQLDFGADECYPLAALKVKDIE